MDRRLKRIRTPDREDGDRTKRRTHHDDQQHQVQHGRFTSTFEGSLPAQALEYTANGTPSGSFSTAITSPSGSTDRGTNTASSQLDRAGDGPLHVVDRNEELDEGVGRRGRRPDTAWRAAAAGGHPAVAERVGPVDRPPNASP
jgi:hypothetical protein